MRFNRWAALGVTAAVLALPGRLAAQRYTIEYTITMAEPASHLYSVQVYVGGLQGRAVELQMPVWSPGRYARMDFARNVQEFSAAAPDGTPVQIGRAHV